jgi:hypothetical protein
VETEYDSDPLVKLRQGDGSAARIDVTVSHDLGDRTLVVVILLAIVIGACGLIMGMNLAKQSRLDDASREIAAKLQIQNNQNSRIEAKLQEIENGKR